MNLSDMTNEELIKESNIFHSNFLLAGTDGKELFETQTELLSRLEQGEKAIKEVEVLKVCRDHWKISYENRHKLIGEILDFYSKWKGVSQNINQTLRTKRNREAWTTIKSVVLKTNGNQME